MKCARDIKKKSSPKLNIYNLFRSFQTSAIIPLVIAQMKAGFQRRQTLSRFQIPETRIRASLPWLEGIKSLLKEI